MRTIFLGLLLLLVASILFTKRREGFQSNRNPYNLPPSDTQSLGFRLGKQRLINDVLQG
jgi:hypothetical protein